MVGADVFAGLSVKGAINQDMVRSMAPESRRLCHGESRSRNYLRRGQSRSPRCHHRHRPLRLSQPGEQCSRIPLHLPRRARRSRHRYQRRDETGRHARAGGSRERRGSRLRLPRLWRRAPAVRPRVSHPEAIRSARVDVGSLGRCRSRHGSRSRAGAGRTRYAIALNSSAGSAKPTKSRAP